MCSQRICVIFEEYSLHFFELSEYRTKAYTFFLPEVVMNFRKLEQIATWIMNSKERKIHKNTISVENDNEAADSQRQTDTYELVLRAHLRLLHHYDEK